MDVMIAVEMKELENPMKALNILISKTSITAEYDDAVVATDTTLYSNRLDRLDLRARHDRQVEYREGRRQPCRADVFRLTGGGGGEGGHKNNVLTAELHQHQQHQKQFTTNSPRTASKPLTTTSTAMTYVPAKTFLGPALESSSLNEANIVDRKIPFIISNDRNDNSNNKMKMDGNEEAQETTENADDNAVVVVQSTTVDLNLNLNNKKVLGKQGFGQSVLKTTAVKATNDERQINVSDYSSTSGNNCSSNAAAIDQRVLASFSNKHKHQQELAAAKADTGVDSQRAEYVIDKENHDDTVSVKTRDMKRAQKQETILTNGNTTEKVDISQRSIKSEDNNNDNSSNILRKQCYQREPSPFQLAKKVNDAKCISHCLKDRKEHLRQNGMMENNAVISVRPLKYGVATSPKQVHGKILEKSTKREEKSACKRHLVRTKKDALSLKDTSHCPYTNGLLHSPLLKKQRGDISSHPRSK